MDRRTCSWFLLLAGLACAASSARAGGPTTPQSPYSMVPVQAGFFKTYPQPAVPAPVVTHPGPWLPAPCPPAPGTCPFPGQPGEPSPEIPSDPGTMPPTDQPPSTTDPGSTPPATDTPAADSATQAAGGGEGGTAAGASLGNTIFGDLGGRPRYRVVQIPNRPGPPPNPVQQPGSVTIASFAANAFKITDNESPRPMHRVFVTFNYFNDINGAINPPGYGTNNLYRETLGIEQTFLGGNASFGIRLPFVHDSGPNDILIDDSVVGDLNLIFKFAPYNDRRTGNVLSGGLVLTLPTGPSFPIPGESDLHPVLFQPFVGYVFNAGDFYVQGFSSILLATDMREPILLFNTVCAGVQLYGNRNPDAFLTGIFPQFEVHVNTPLTHRGTDSGPTGFPDLVDLTGGLIFQFCNRAVFGTAIGTPVTGPKPWAFEGTAYFSLYF